MKSFILFLILAGFAIPVSASEPVPVGTTTISYGIFDSDGNITHELAVGQKYEIKAHFKSDLDEPVSFTYFVRMIDKDKRWCEPVDEFRANGLLQPHEYKSFAFEWTPEYEGRFRTFSEMGNTASGTTIGGVPQYDFEVIPSRLQTTSSDGTSPEMLKAQESMRIAFDANVNVEGFPIRDIVIGHGTGDGKYVVEVNAGFFDSKYWPDIQK